MSLALIEPICRAVDHDRASLAETLMELIFSGSFDDPNLYANACPDRYARRLIWRDPDNRFVVVGMTWAPGQTAALHDHGGAWGVEIVAAGTMCETPYTVVERDPSAGRVRFRRECDRIVGKGVAGVLTPPFDFHTFGNAGTTTAYTLHVYGGSFAQLKTFVSETDGWYRETKVALTYDA